MDLTDFNESDLSEGTDPTVVTVVANTITFEEDNGIKPPRGTVIGHVYEDTNSNGVQDSNESNITGATVTVTDANGNTYTGTTNANGDYNITDVLEGNASVEINETSASTPSNGELLADANQTEGDNPTLVTVVNNTTVNAGNDGYAPAANLPDYRPTVNILLGQSNTGPTATLKITFRIVENLGGVNTGDLRFRVPKHETMTTTYDPNMTVLHGATVNNADWEFSETSTYYELKYLPTGGKFPAGGDSFVGFEFNFIAPDTQKGKIPVKATIQGPPSGDTVIENDRDEDFLIFNNL